MSQVGRDGWGFFLATIVDCANARERRLLSNRVEYKLKWMACVLWRTIRTIFDKQKYVNTAEIAFSLHQGQQNQIRDNKTLKIKIQKKWQQVYIYFSQRTQLGSGLWDWSPSYVKTRSWVCFKLRWIGWLAKPQCETCQKYWIYQGNEPIKDRKPGALCKCT